MTKRIKNLSVSRISILTTDHEPAVPKAGLGFSILKFFKREKLDTSRMDSILEKLSGVPEVAEDAGEPATEARMDAIVEKFSIDKAGPGTWDTTTDMYRYRIRMPSDFDTSTFRTVQLNKTGKTIKSVIGKIK